MKYSDNIPSFNDICGTVTQALAEIILNREAIIAELRKENAETKNLLRERCINNASLIEQNSDLRREIEGWKLECETNEHDEKELYRLRTEVLSLRNQLIVSQNSHFDCDKQCKILLEERDEARRQYCELVAELDSEMKEDIARANEWDDLYSIDNTPSLFGQSDSDPRTGVQYGDLT